MEVLCIRIKVAKLKSCEFSIPSDSKYFVSTLTEYEQM